MNTNETFDKALALYNAQDFDQAIKLCNEILQYDQNHHHTWNLLGNIFFTLDELDSAKDFLVAAINIKADYFEPYFMLGNVLFKAKLYKEAIGIWEEAAKLNPDFALTFANIAISHQMLKDLKNSFEYCEKALALDANNIDALMCMAKNYHIKLDIQNSKTYLEKVIEIDPNYPLANFDLSYIYLLEENYKKGFELFEWRMKMPERAQEYNYMPFQPWNKENLTDKSLLIYHEQGFGDNIQFCRFLNQLNAKEITIGIQNPLNKLMQYNFPNINFVSEIHANAGYDFMTPMMSLPFQLKLETIPTSKAYLDVEEKDITQFTNDYLDTTKFNIGLVWKGSSTSSVNKKRSLELKNLEPLLNIQDVQYHSLQIEQNEDIETYNINNLGENFKDFYDTAVAIKSLDLIISVDTAVAHLSGALGMPTVVLYDYTTIDFRWAAKEQKSLWYETISIYSSYEQELIQTQIETLIKDKHI